MRARKLGTVPCKRQPQRQSGGAPYRPARNNAWAKAGRLLSPGEILFLVLHLDHEKACRCLPYVGHFVPRDWWAQHIKIGGYFLLWLEAARVLALQFPSSQRVNEVCRMLMAYVLRSGRKRATQNPYLIVFVKFLTRSFSLPLNR